jgi:hypothetical protein
LDQDLQPIRILSEDLKQEWIEKQKQIKEQEVELTFNYWDGSGWCIFGIFRFLT